MKLYNRNVTRKRLDQLRRWTITDRDAIVWSVDTNNFYALVKIQGSNVTIKAHYPRNWRTTPVWLKRGNAVRIRHRAGAQGFIELVGHGRAIPTPVEGDQLPTPTELTDGIVSGMEILEYDGGGMNVVVNNGTYRIDGTVYVYTVAVTGYTVMDDPAPMVMGSNLEMGWGDTITPIAIGAAPAAGYGRYDALVIGTNGVVDVIEGAASALTSEPGKPGVPTDHVLIGYLFIYGGMTSIPQNAIGVEWTPPAINTIETAATGYLSKQGDGSFQFAWHASDNTPVDNIQFTAKDQYGVTRSISATATMTMLNGTGGVGISGSGPFNSSASNTMTSSINFYYERNQLASPEVSPLIKVEFTGYPSLTYIFTIILLDSGGDPV